MTVIDTAMLLAEVPPEAPCGPNIEYDPDYQALQRSARAAPEERAVGPSVAAEEPAWREIADRTLVLLTRSKDLRLAAMLSKALLHVDGLAGLRAGTTIIRSLLEQHWQHVHPQLDADNDDDPTMRINTLRELTDRREVLNVLRALTILEVPGVGRFSLKEHLALESLPPSASAASRAAKSRITAVLAGCDPMQLRAAVDNVSAIRVDLREIESWITHKVEIGSAVSFGELEAVLAQIEGVLVPTLAARSNPMIDEPASATNGRATEVSASPARKLAVAPGQVTEIASRADVQRVLDQLCDYYDVNEPSSPVPLLLRRARRLSAMSFLDIVRDLAPGGAAEVESIRGAQRSDNS